MTDLFACLSMLTIDAVPTPEGDLLVACHSGKPDWGTGPQGKGKLFKISYSDKAPQPVLAYAASPTETRVVFDRILGSKTVSDARKQRAVAAGKYVIAGERFESFRPGYQVVKIQNTMPRFEWPVTNVRVADQRSLVIETGARTEAVNSVATLSDAIDVLAD